jgi:hypothetical protein
MGTRLKLFIYLFLCSLNTSNAQNINWINNYGGFSYDDGYKILPSKNGGYYLLGVINSNDLDALGNHGLADIALIRTDETGNKIWVKCIGGSNDDIPQNFIFDKDSNLLIVGISTSIDGDFSGGNLNAEGVLIKADSNGNILNVRYSGGNDLDMFSDLFQDSTGNIIVVGETESTNISNFHGNTDYYLLKFDSALNLLWQTSFGGQGVDIPSRVIPYKQGYLIGGKGDSNTGQVTGSHGHADIWIIRSDTMGNFLFGNCVGGTENEEFADFVLDTLDNIYITGGTVSNDGDVSGNHLYLQLPTTYGSDVWVVEMDTNLNLIKQLCIGGSDYDLGKKIKRNKDRYYILIESFSTDYDIPCTQGGPNGAVVTLFSDTAFSFNFCFGGFGDDVGNDLEILNDSMVIILGGSTSPSGQFMNINYGDKDIFLTELSTSFFSSIATEPEYENKFNAYVDNNTLHLKALNSDQLTLYISDINGRSLFHKEFRNTLNSTIDILLNDFLFQSGIYNVTIFSAYTVKNFRFIL